MTNFFQVTVRNISKLFSDYLPEVTGQRGQALKQTGPQFIAIGHVLAEGGCTGPLSEIATMKLFDAQLAVNGAIEHEWNGGKNTR